MLVLAAALTACGVGPPGPSEWRAYIDGNEVAVPEIPMGDTATVMRILEEGRDRNQVMVHLQHLAEVIGTRLTGSTGSEKAEQWIVDLYNGWGLDSARREQWGEIGVRFDRGPSTGKMVIAEEPRRPRGGQGGGEGGGEAQAEQPAEPTYRTLREFEFTTLSWTRGTDGPVRGRVIRAPKTDEEYEAVKDSLDGAWILLQAPPAVGQRGIRSRVTTYFEQRKDARQKLAEGADVMSIPLPQRLEAHDVAGYISTSRDERVWTGAINGWRDLTIDTVPPETHVVVRSSDYDALNSRLADGEPVEAEFDLPHTFEAGPIPVYNVIGEIRGATKPDEVVIICAHLDSWDGPGSQGVLDNGGGTAVMIEAMRLLKVSGARPDRTIRVMHWTGEEQGLLGARAWVRANESAWPNISMVLNDDGGTNSQGGVPATAEMVPMLAAASAPVNNIFTDAVSGRPLRFNVRTVERLPRGASSDHAAFISVGIPGFFTDEVGRSDYGFGWHTQHDKFNLAIPEYLKQSATNAAVMMYRMASAPTLLPREPRREEPAEGQGSGEGRPAATAPASPAPARPAGN
jgi:hypothetical protein